MGTRAKGDATMKRRNLSPKDYLRNKRIIKKDQSANTHSDTLTEITLLERKIIKIIE